MIQIRVGAASMDNPMFDYFDSLVGELTGGPNPRNFARRLGMIVYYSHNTRKAAISHVL